MHRNKLARWRPSSSSSSSPLCKKRHPRPLTHPSRPSLHPWIFPTTNNSPATTTANLRPLTKRRAALRTKPNSATTAMYSASETRKRERNVDRSSGRDASVDRERRGGGGEGGGISGGRARESKLKMSNIWECDASSSPCVMRDGRIIVGGFFPVPATLSASFLCFSLWLDVGLLLLL
ncbi:hypothetical protein DFJ77DRAFT_457282 [Powellomyces hirtus]|nr:hypothetical protein DFJ77DRAFT_457282 [Powellomyces hirtus]